MGTTKTMLKGFGLVAAAIVASGASSTGTYVGGDASSAILLQVVETGEGRIQGGLTITTMDKPSGRIRAESLPVNGVSDKDQLSLQLNGRTVVATARGSVITLNLIATGGSLANVSLTRAPVSEFERRVQALQKQSDAVVVRNKREKLTKDIDALVRKVEAFRAKVHNDLPRLRSLPDKYEALTTRMQQGLERERVAASQSARSQISFELSVLVDSGPMEETERTVSFLKRSFEDASKAHRADFDALKRDCSSLRGEPLVDSACQKLLRVTAVEDPDVRGFPDAVSFVEEQYAAEKIKQKRIAEEAKMLE